MALAILVISYQRPSTRRIASPTRALALNAVPVPVTVAEFAVTVVLPLLYQGMGNSYVLGIKKPALGGLERRLGLVVLK